MNTSFTSLRIPLTIAVFLIAIFYSGSSVAQVGINPTGANPNAKAGLDVDFTDKGLLPPRLTTVQRDAITSPIPEGLTIFNTTTKCFEFYAYSMWQTGACAVCPIPAAPAAGAHVAGTGQITWAWLTSTGATGYKVNTSNNYGGATDVTSNLTYLQTGLSCGSSNTLYVWAYNACGYSASPSVFTFSPSPCPFTCGGTVTDIDGNVYNTVQIGSQCWLRSNLKTTKYRNGTPIDYPGTNNSLWVNNTTGAYAWFDNNIANGATYGAHYNWYAVDNVNGLCPTGWHVPNDSEWGVMISSLGGFSVSGGKMKSLTGWNSPNAGANNSSGFTGVGASIRWQSDGTYFPIGYSGYFSSSTSNSATHTTYWQLDTNTDDTYTESYFKGLGVSVRCILN